MKKYITVALILAVGLVSSAYIVSRFYLRIRKEDAIAVKGTSQRLLISSTGKLSFNVIDTDPVLSNALIRVRDHYKILTGRIGQQYGEQIRLYLEEPGIKQVMKTTAQGRETDQLAYYWVACQCGVITTNVNLIAKIATMLTDYATENILVQMAAPEYLLSDLPTIKVELLQEATQDGWKRAKALTQEKGRIGRLVSARQGVFQITAPLSTTDSPSDWAGEYDTSSIEKEIRAVVSLEFEVK
jgi:hypothetical protein